MPKESPLANHTIGELQIGERTRAMVPAIRTSEGRFDTTPLRPGRHPHRRHPDRARRPRPGDRLEVLMRGEEPAAENPS